MKLSVIIPVYKVEKTLDRCIESVLRQNVPDMEIILVDDGSPDKCPQMCDEWIKKDSHIKVIHKTNGGLSDARNAGLDAAHGEYVTFVDSDDYLMLDTYPTLISLLQSNPRVDMLEYVVLQKIPERPEIVLQNQIFDSPKEYWLKTKAWLHSYAWNKVYRRKIFKDCRYLKNRTFEDLLLLPQLLKRCDKVATVSSGTYVYTVNADGISRQVTIRSVSSLLRAEMKSAWVMKTMPWSSDGKNLYYYICCRCYDILRLLIGIKL